MTVVELHTRIEQELFKLNYTPVRKKWRIVYGKQALGWQLRVEGVLPDALSCTGDTMDKAISEVLRFLPAAIATEKARIQAAKPH